MTDKITLAEIKAIIDTYDDDLARFEPREITMHNIALREFQKKIIPDYLRALLAVAEAAVEFDNLSSEIDVARISHEASKVWDNLSSEVKKLKDQ